MTFIATVIAKKGAALIADSLVTTSKPILEYEDFYKYMESKVVKDNNGEINISLDAGEVVNLFKSKPSYTKDFQEKLFEYGSHTAIATAGAARLNNKSLENIITSAKKSLIKKGDSTQIKTRVQELAKYLNKEANECLKSGNEVYHTIFIITRFSKMTQKTVIYKLHVNRSSPKDLKDGEELQCVSFQEQPDYSTVVCEGQNRITEKILWGDIDTVYELIPKVATQIFKDFNINPAGLPKDYVTELSKNKDVLPKEFYYDIKMNKLRELSLQQAVDLACLLMRIERDIQKYTENIPTVGGNVKVAVINENGFRFLSGHELKSQSF
ncbi:hypothetical protein SAMN05444410_106119 [Hydrobacter penzbergensis]|uniref:Uncharacterized protein n=1 Tax=Hydrobacter penzbergensis TaxID=1235997 RepID=A0A8X8IGW4_9BACT|nr:hypothetical protein [Hydrobacter penzbergensis]SDW84724.1 hypothetical protein SAMN05444410_106119 [Hydrobacter penzbergensis]